MLYKTGAIQWWLGSRDKTDEASRNILITLVFLVILWFISLVLKQNRLQPSSPPGPRGLPLVGYLPFLGPNLYRTFSELQNVYGSIFKIQIGTKLWIVISSPSLAAEVVRDQDVTFANRDPSVASKIASLGASDITFSNYGHEWRKMRKIFASEMLSNSRLDASYCLRKQQVKKMIADIYEKAGEVVDIGELAFVAIMNSVTSMVWGQILKGSKDAAIKAEFRPVLQEFMQLLAMPNISDFFPLLARFDLQGIGRRMKAISLQCERIIDSAINHYNDLENNGQIDFLGYLLQLTKSEDPAMSLTIVQVKSMLMDIVIGGMDTSVTIVEWAMAEMLRHPNVMEEVQEELAKIVGLNSSIEEAHLSELKYLKAVVKETFRLHAPLPLLVPHCSSKSATVGGYMIPKGSQIFLNVRAIQTDPQLWEAPLEFQPERFMRGSSAEAVDYGGNHLQFLPFGSGRRICPGIPLAERTVMHVLASLLHAFEWSLPNGVEDVDLSEKFGIVVKKEKPLLAVPRPRLSRLKLYSYSD